MFHHFHDETHPNVQGAISADQLRKMLEKLGPERFLSPQEWSERALSGSLRKDDLCLTLDDALLCQHDVALPVFEEFGLKAFWFVYSSVFEGTIERLELYRYFRTVHYPEIDTFYRAFSATVREEAPDAYDAKQRSFNPARYLAAFAFYSDADRWFRYLRDELLGATRYNEIMDRMIAQSGLVASELRDRLWMNNDHLANLVHSGHVIGLHSTTHPTRLERMSKAEQEQEYRHNLDHLSKVTGVRPHSMSHPCNSYSSQTLELLYEMDIKIGFRSNMAQDSAHGLLEFPREDHANLLRTLNL